MRGRHRGARIRGMEKNIAFIVAPLLTVVYGVVRLLDSIDGERGPGIAWTVGHLAFLGALGLFAVVVWEMRRRAGRGQFATGTAVVALVGIGCAVVQFGIDLVVGMLATDHAAMSRCSSRCSRCPVWSSPCTRSARSCSIWD